MRRGKQALSDRIPEYFCDVLSVNLALGVSDNLRRKACVMIDIDSYSNNC